MLISACLLLLTLGSGPSSQTALQTDDPQLETPQEQHALGSVSAYGNVPCGRLPAEHSGEVKLEGAPPSPTPPNREGPVLVELGPFIIEVTNIDEVSSTFTIERSH